MRRALLIVAAAAVVAGCGSHKAPEVAWAPLRPPALPAASGPCTASQLRSTATFQGATGGAVGQVVLRNAGAKPCSLSGRPTIRVLPAVPQVFSRQRSTKPAEFPAAWLQSLAGNRRASVDVTWFNWCNQSKPRLTVTLPGGRGTLTVKPSLPPRCIVAGTPTTISADVLAPALGGSNPPWTRLALSARVLGPTGDKPATTLEARRGAVLHYRVELTNASKHTLSFGTCPLFEQQLAPAAPQAYVLNCRSVQALKPGKSAIFAMELAVPLQQPLGRSRLFWALDPYSSAASVDADAGVVVQPAG